MDEDESLPPKRFRTQITISSLSNERRVIQFGDIDEDQLQGILEKINLAFNTVRNSRALGLTGADGLVTFINLDNVVFIEVHVG